MRNGLSTSEAGKLGAVESAKTRATHKQDRISIWNANPKLCKFCDNPIDYDKRRNDFCNQSCGAAFNNKGIRRHGEEPLTCLNCGIPHYNEKFCSHKCNSDFDWKNTKKELISTGIDNSNANRFGKKYLIEFHAGKCQTCYQSEWQGQPMPLVLDHINGNPYDNSMTNLRVICHNCNAQTPTFTGRNKGNGRVERARRWKVEKEVFNQTKLM